MARINLLKLFMVPVILILYQSIAKTCNHVLHPGDSASVIQIIDKYIQASGGDALAGIKTEIRKGTLVRGTNGQVPFETKARAPGQWYYAQTFAWGDQVAYIFNGNKGWVQDTKSISGMSPGEVLYLQLLLDMHAPLKIRGFFPEMAIRGSEMINDKEATTITARSPEGLVIELAFDNETGLLLRAGDIYFEDYREVGSVNRPFKILLGRNQGEHHLQMIMQLADIQHNIDIDEAQFEQPECMLPMKESPIYRDWQQVEINPAAMDACAGEYQLAPGQIISVTREHNHLMIKFPGSGIKYEICPESETDYFIRFINLPFHFIKDDAGSVTHMEIGADRSRKAQKIK